MAAGNLQQILLPRMAAARGVGAFDGTTKPTQVQVITWLNDGVKDIVRQLVPRRLKSGEWSAGRLDKLTQLLGQESENGSSGFAGLPTTTEEIGYHYCITLGGIGVRYEMKEVSLGEVWDRTTNFAPTATNPIYSYSESGGTRGIQYLPISETSVSYFYIRTPTLMVYDTAEDFPLDEDTIPLVVNYAAGCMWMSQASGKQNIALGKLFMDFYQAGMNALIGESASIVSRRD